MCQRSPGAFIVAAHGKHCGLDSPHGCMQIPFEVWGPPDATNTDTFLYIALKIRTHFLKSINSYGHLAEIPYHVVVFMQTPCVLLLLSGHFANTQNDTQLLSIPYCVLVCMQSLSYSTCSHTQGLAARTSAAPTARMRGVRAASSRWSYATLYMSDSRLWIDWSINHRLVIMSMINILKNIILITLY